MQAALSLAIVLASLIIATATYLKGASRDEVTLLNKRLEICEEALKDCQNDHKAAQARVVELTSENLMLMRQIISQSLGVKGSG